MSIEYVKGDLFQGDEKVIVHGCNNQGGFDKGFAGALRKHHPAALKAYMDQHDNQSLILGSVIWAVDGDKLIGNAIVQPSYGRKGTGRHISYEALEAALIQVNIAATYGLPGTPFKEGFDRISMPMIGSNLGGGDWNVIEEIIRKTLQPIKTFVYVLAPDKTREEQLNTKLKR